MPGRDKTGPNGNGPITGRGLGYCAGENVRGFGFGRGRGFSRGYGYGRGMGYRYGQMHELNSEETIHEESRETLLENEARVLKEQLAAVEKQLTDLKNRRG